MRRFLLACLVLSTLSHLAHAQQPSLPGAPAPVPGAPLSAASGDLEPGRHYTVTLRDGTTFRGTLTTKSAEVLEFDTPNLGHLVVQRSGVLRIFDSDLAPPVGPSEVVGQPYNVELLTGTSFLGVLQEANPQSLTFDARGLGVVTVQRTNLRQLLPLSAKQFRKGYEDVGNATRMFFAPTAHNLRKGEGYVQSIDVILAGVNYGITDNFSVGVLLPVTPSAGISVLAITPKVSAPVSDKVSLGVGVAYAFASGGSGGVGYGVATYGTNDSNVTLGAGYGFTSGEVSRSPVVVLGGNLRVSNRVFLVDENYIYSAGVSGLVGLRVAAPRLSGSLGILYSSQLPIFIPAYVEVAYRFGKVRR